MEDTETTCPTTPPSTTLVVARGNTAEVRPIEELAAALADPEARAWIDLVNTGEAGFAALAPTLVFHPMAVEDCVVDLNRPKVDDYRDYLYVAFHSARWDDLEKPPVLKEIDVLLGSNYILTYHEEETRGIDRARALLERRGDLLSRGPDHLLYYVLDVMVDNYLPIIEAVHDRIDGLEERVLHRPNRRLLAEILRLKRGLAAIRRVVGPQRDTILALTRDEYGVVRAEIRPYLRDVYDRMARISDLLDSFRDELATILDIYVSQVSNQLNEVMKVLTAITVVIVPVTLIASVYGMNVDFPGTGTRGGFYASLGLMVATALGMILYFRGRRWL